MEERLTDSFTCEAERSHFKKKKKVFQVVGRLLCVIVSCTLDEAPKVPLLYGGKGEQRCLKKRSPHFKSPAGFQAGF